MGLSCFAPCGLLELSSQKPLAQTIYEQIQRSHGPAYDSENFNGVFSAKWYADAMSYAAARKSLERAKNQADPLRCYDLLTSHERFYGIVPPPRSTLSSRHGALAAAMLLPIGPRRGNVEYQLRALLGDDFVAWVTPPAATSDPASFAAASQQAFPDSPETQGRFDDPALWKTIELTDIVAFTNTPVSVPWESVDGDEGTITVGDELVVAPGLLGQQELVTVTARTDTALTATFRRSHEAGTMAMRQPWPFWLSNQLSYAIVVRNGRATDASLRQKVSALLNKLLDGTSIWSIVEENVSPGTSGPMVPGSNTWRLGITPMGTLQV